MKKLFAILIINLFLLSTPKIFAHEGVTHEMIMYADYYEPNDLEIKQGDTVLFVNESEQSMWPASNIHPTHAIYSDFDPQQEIAIGESWSFTFDKVGEWKYHDHLNPNIEGNINVLPDEHQIPTKPSYWDFWKEKLSSFFSKTKIEFKKTYFKIFDAKKQEYLNSLDLKNLKKDAIGLSEALSILTPEVIMKKLLADSGNGSVIDCHAQAHIIGRESFKIIGAKVFEIAGPECHSGFYHGAMEQLLAEQGLEDLESKITKVCEVFKTNFGIFECFHGVGHGVLAYTSYDLIEALNICQSINNRFASDACMGGVFMENVVTGQGIGAVEGHTTEWLSDDMHFPCNVLSMPNQISQCYLMQTSWMLHKNGYNFDSIKNECLNAPEGYEYTCYQSFGRDAAGFHLRDPQTTLKSCSVVPNLYFDACVSGAVQVVLDFWGKNVEEKAFIFCQQIENEESHTKCTQLASARLTGLFETQEEAISKCELAGEDKNTCIELLDK